MRYEPEELKAGCRYRVVLDDCCVAGEFTSVLTKMWWDEGASWDGWSVEVAEFENGVKLTTLEGVRFFSWNATDEEVRQW